MRESPATKILIVRFSSFGDIVQCLSAVDALRKRFPEAELHWVTKNTFAPLVRAVKGLDHVWVLEDRKGIQGLFSLARQLRAERFTHLYDAHKNLRTLLLVPFLRFGRRLQYLQRSKDRWKRFLLFRFRINPWGERFAGALSYLTPLTPWGVVPDFSRLDWKADADTIKKVDALLGNSSSMIALVPSAAWPLKTWPAEHWQSLVKLFPQQTFVVLGSAHETECQALPTQANVINFAGKTTLIESVEILTRSQQVVVADTGFLHVADALGIPTVALIGPTAFGFPSGDSVKVLEKPLPCRPCSKDGRGTCSREIYKECLVSIRPEEVAARVSDLMPG